MNKRIAIYLILTTLVVTWFVQAKPLVAQEGTISPTIGVSPAKIVETVTSGKTSEVVIRLRNYSKDPLPLSAELTNITAIQESGIPLFTDQVGPRSAKQWLEIVDRDVIVSPGEQQAVRVKISVPPQTVPGGYHASVIFQARLPSYYFDLDSDTRILPAISVLFFLTVSGEGVPFVSDLKVDSFQVPKVVVSTPVSMVARINNPTNFFVQANATATITGGINKHQEKQDLGQILLLPEGLRRFVSAFDDRLWPGIYTASLEFKQGDKVLVASSRFLAIPWQFLVLLTLLLAVVLFFAFRRRFARAWRVLLGKEATNKRPVIR